MKENIITALLDWNPWLEGEFPSALLGVPREYHLLDYLKVKEIKIIEGARRVGKSTLLYQVIADVLKTDKRVLYINFDDETLRNYSLSEIFFAFLEKQDVDYLFIDEIQNCTEWVPFIRKMYDQKKLKQIWLTGSNSSLIKEEYAAMLTGRHIDIHIHPLSFREFLHFKEFDINTDLISAGTQAIIKRYFNEYMHYGSFPAVVLSESLKKELLLNYFNDFIYKDIAARYPVDASKVKDLGKYLASNATKCYSYRNLSKALNLHANTVTDYYHYLQAIFLFYDLDKFDYSLQKQYMGSRKAYILDTGLASAVSFKFSTDVGRMLENVVFSELLRTKQEIYFHNKGSECDFITKQDITINQAIQVCYDLDDPKTKQRAYKGLLDALQTYNLESGIILTMAQEADDEVVLHGKHYEITILPVWKWLLVRCAG